MLKYNLAAAIAIFQLIASTSLAGAEPVSFPDISPTLNKNENPYKIDGDILGDIHIGGALTGFAMAQTNAIVTDDDSHLDLSNGQLFIQKNSGLIQFYAQAGGYSIPSLGLPYMQADDTIDNLFGVLPVAYVTIAPHENFSISAGKLPTLIGAEYTFTFQNLNIQRGLLWNQENAVNRGVQLDYVNGDFSAAISFNDGFYSDHFNWVSGLIDYDFNANHNVYVSGGANLGDTRTATFATPLLQNNDNILTVAYAYSDEKWLVSPYVQYNHVKENRSIGINDEGSTLGFALLANHKCNENYGIAARAEYITSSGGSSMLYGSDSDAWSITLTPTYKEGAFFARADLAYVGLSNAANSAGFGERGNEDGQARFVLETGLVF